MIILEKSTNKEVVTRNVECAKQKQQTRNEQEVQTKIRPNWDGKTNNKKMHAPVEIPSTLVLQKIGKVMLLLRAEREVRLYDWLRVWVSESVYDANLPKRQQQQRGINSMIRKKE